MLEVGYVEKPRWKKRMIILLGVVFIFFSVVRQSFGLDLGPAIAILKAILEVERIANGYLENIQKLQDQTIGRIEQVRNTIYKYTNLPSEVIGRAQNIINKAEDIRKRNEILFTQDFYRNGKYNTGALKDIERWLDTVYVDENGVVKSAKTGNAVSDKEIKGFTFALTQLPPDIEGAFNKIKNKTPEMKYAVEVAKTQRTTLNSAVASSVFVQQQLEKIKPQIASLSQGLNTGLDAGELVKRQAMLTALITQLIALQTEMQLKQMQINSMEASYYLNKREQEVYNKLKAYEVLEGGK